MNKIVLFASLAMLAPNLTLAQTQSGETNSTSETPAVTTTDSNNPAAPVAGENSFTEDQARQRIADAGFTDPKDLKLDDQGFWNASAMKDGKQVNVVMDYQGNVVAK